ncbi:Gfo/Idh/MocA family protein [Aestuariibaculum suncheonense]|uniref:Gfo/Idh/MocA family oxidoreductase n=1 Tax=Aestuariibaculum suncheonense TaxID=1028745 RepID=A0A8J6Q8U2_9FLAO|nr:Gfo/Idh/MocA family oxidoreductase [Aestuariibaculum suncheonense]MBD0836209.1 Gfo/Idh/MocA family oxidoreductase [Aestuariibaculum suncheonense]
MTIKQTIDLPSKPLPIIIIGAGGIVKDAHLPAYQIAGFRVLGIYDIDKEKAISLKSAFPIVEKIYNSFEDAISESMTHQVIFDLALPAAFHIETLKKLPNHSVVLLQKPMGETLAEAKQIKTICNEKELTAAVNFQLQFAPYMIAAKQLINDGLLGDVYDMELMVNVNTPWHLWDFLFDLPRVEILYHSIHYFDLIRGFLGNPEKIYASTRKHPKMLDLASTRTTAILDYPNHVQARIITNHGHNFGLKHQASYFKIEGSKGAIHIRIGVSLDYPNGMPPTFEYYNLEAPEKGWQNLKLEGKWFPHAFIGSMGVLQKHCIDKSSPLPNSVEEALDTMKIVEAAYKSSDSGGLTFNSIE